MKILITGALGQLGKALTTKLASHKLALVDLPETDITDRESIFNSVEAFQPEIVIHCAAFTHVDECTRQPQLAYRVNSLGTQNVALACHHVDAVMVHISTNEVFSGTRLDGYEEWMPLDPRNTYGRTKAAAEEHVRHILQKSYIVRLAWLFAPGGRNFIHAILEQAQKQRQLRVVTDEIGNPTYSEDLAEAIAQLVKSGQYGIYHFVNQGACSRYDFAHEILHQVGLADVKLIPILSSEFVRASSPPPFGALKNITGNSIGISLRPWQEAVAEYINKHVT
ncbi:MAG: dTDP-4-dehydrorhamnose reductase [Candidatus Promineifilaceae bacterium]|nr:dTDP-4-dehydrorhamnose reductase [Candidatus Promineifilaceae bacterium]